VAVFGIILAVVGKWMYRKPGMFSPSFKLGWMALMMGV